MHGVPAPASPGEAGGGAAAGRGSSGEDARRAARRVPQLEGDAEVIAYKFLAAGSVAPFTGFPWPLPQGGAPGAWVEAPPPGSPDLGVHGCRAEDLPYWVE